MDLYENIKMYNICTIKVQKGKKKMRQKMRQKTIGKK